VPERVKADTLLVMGRGLMVMLWISAGAAAWLIGAGCASSLPASTSSEESAPSAAPEDFSLSMIERGSTPAWVIVQPDGEIRAGVGLPRADSPAPPRVRQVDRATVSRVWRLAQEAGVFVDASDAKDPDAAAEIATDPSAPREASAGGFTFAWAAGGRRGVREIAGSSSSSSSSAAASLARELRALAWIDQP
jgi:hypothetical protein